MTMRVEFASDNVSAIAPEALEGIVRANAGFTPAYGADPYTARAAVLLRELFDADAEIFFVGSGTAANAVSLAAMCCPFETVLAHEHAHIFTDEAGAPSFFGRGIGATPLPGASGRMAPHSLAAALNRAWPTSSQSPGVLSISNATEYGTVYDEAALRSLIDIASAGGVPTQIDGARLSNAAAAGLDLKSFSRLGVGILVAGGAKSGLPASEAILIFDRALVRRFGTRLKQAGQVVSKARFASAAWIAMLESGAWIERARHANVMAHKLARLMPFELAHPVETNAVFVHMHPAAHARLTQAGWKALRFADGSVRFMCSWATTEALVEELGAVLSRIV
jgi:threonine aldolase